jgi:hypothetical protein
METDDQLVARIGGVPLAFRIDHSGGAPTRRQDVMGEAAEKARFTLTPVPPRAASARVQASSSLPTGGAFGVWLMVTYSLQCLP